MECKFQFSARTLCLVYALTYSRECEGMLGGGQLERKVPNCTHVIVSLLKTRMWLCYGYSVTMPSFNALREVPHQKLFSQEKNLNSSSKVANWIIVDILKYFN